jgi:hypothetical protein
LIKSVLPGDRPGRNGTFRVIAEYPAAVNVPGPVAPLRVSRGAAFAAAALGLGLGAHLAGGGNLPGLGALVLLAVPVAWISFFLTRARRGWPVIVTALIAVETGLHAGLSLLSGSGEYAASIQVAPQGPMMGAHAAAMSHSATGMPSAGGMSGMSLVPSLAMIAAHLVATALTGAALAHGERLLWNLWSWVHHAVTVLLVLVQFPTPRTTAPQWLLTVSVRPILVGRHVRRRGPPRLEAGLSASA